MIIDKLIIYSPDDIIMDHVFCPTTDSLVEESSYLWKEKPYLIPRKIEGKGPTVVDCFQGLVAPLRVSPGQGTTSFWVLTITSRRWTLFYSII
jgi:hypothetical protein